MGNEHDTKMRIKRAARIWTRKKRSMKYKLSKKMLAKVVETCVGSTILFNSAVRLFQNQRRKEYKAG